MKDVNITADLDAVLKSLPQDEALALHLSGSLETAGVYRAGQYRSRNLGTGWTIDGDAEISSLSPGQGWTANCSPSLRPSAIRERVVLRGNQSSSPPDGASAPHGGVWLDGDGVIDHVTLHDFGARGKEAFVATVAEGSGPASITNCLFTDFVPRASDTQVTVFMIAGEYDLALHEGNETDAPEGWVQGHTIYRAKQGIARSNKTKCRIGYYADYFGNKNRTIVGNEFTGAEYGIQIQLSPTGDDGIDPAYFSHENYTIGPNVIQSTGKVNVLASIRWGHRQRQGLCGTSRWMRAYPSRTEAPRT